MQEERQLNVEDVGERTQPAKRGRKKKTASDAPAQKKKPKRKRRKIAEDSYDSEGDEQLIGSSDDDYE